jgi:bifunctional non-homologous end joining protein LigD
LIPSLLTIFEVEGRELTTSNLDKLFYPESGYTKGQVIAFYSQIAEAIIPHLRDRPLTLKRHPDGTRSAARGFVGGA